MDDEADEFRGIGTRIERAIALCEELNELRYAQAEEIRAAFSELTGRPVDETFSLIPPLYCDYGLNLTVGRNVFVNQGCSLNDIGGIEIGDDVMIGPGARLISSGHHLDPARRRRITAAPIRLERGVWIGAGAHVLQGVTIGADAVVGAGAVVTRDVPAATLVAGVPARPVKRVDES
jgi:acetyltransferase-like isoleucine patch superfamily enzyme